MRLAGLSLLSLLFLVACGGNEAEQQAEAKRMVEAAFADLYKEGPFGSEILGKGVWYKSMAFSPGCLQAKDLAFTKDTRVLNPRNPPEMSPTYAAQRYLTTTTDRGFCIYMGEGLQMTTGPARASGSGDQWMVEMSFSAKETSPWWDCIDTRWLTRPIPVQVDPESDALSLEMRPDLFLGQCPSPLPADRMERKGGKRPTAKAPKPPTIAEARAVIKRFDDALWEHDTGAALEVLSCYNLFEKEPWGACARSEVVHLGPMSRGGSPRMEDGPPWHQNAFQGLDTLGPIIKDGADPSLFHVQVKQAKGKHKRRTLALQWVAGAWKLVGVVGAKGEGLTTVQVLYDLDRRDRRAIFERRMKGEAIGEDGTPLDAMIRMGYEEAEDE